MRKKFLLMTFLLAIIGFCGTNLRAQGDLQIATETALRDFANAVNSGVSYEGRSVTLTDDITLTGEWTPIGNGSRDSKTYTDNAFKGTFDGGNHTISGLTISSTTGADVAVGLFGIVDGGTVKNLNLTDVSINVTNSNLAGAAIGMMLNGATANNITVSGAIVGNDGVGGIVGRLIIDGTISNCTNNASVTSSYGGIGGIVGKPYYEDGANTSTFASITNCTNNGTITAPMYIGGIAGLARANVTNCTNNGAVVGGTQTGGIVGQLIAAGTVSGNENKAKVSGKNHLGGIIGDYSQSSAYTYNNVSIANNINRGELAATEQCAAIMGCNNIDGFTAMTATGNVSYYYVEGLELFGNPEDMVIDATNKFIVPVAKIGEQTFYTFAEAADAAQAGSEIKLLANIEGDITVPANVTLNGNGFAISGGILAEGDITFAGVTTAADFDANVANTAVNIPAGASLQLTGSARLVIGHGATFNITGTIEDAKTADKATLVPSLKIAAGASITGNGVTFNVNNAYIVANANTTSKNSYANGTLDFNIDNSIWEQTGVLAFYVPTSGKDPVVNFELKNSVLTTTSHLVFSVTKGEIVIDNSLVNQGASRQIENRSTMTIKNGSVVNGAVATSSNAINPGTIIVENATYAVTGEFSGAAEGTGTLVIKEGANVSVGSIKAGANVTVDAEGMAAGDEINFTADLSQFTGTLSVINNDKLEAKIVDGKIVLTAKPVAKIGEQEYMTLETAFAAAISGCTIDILSDVTVDYNWDARYTGGKFTVPVTINGNDKTIKFTASVNDNNYQAPFRFEADATVNNLTIDMSEVTDNRFRAISSKGNLTVDGCKFTGKDETLNCRAIIFGEGAGANVGNLEISITNSEFINWKRGITDNENAQDVKTVTITGNTFEDAAVYVSAYNNVTFTGNTVAGAYVNIKSYTDGNKLQVTATGNTLEPNTDSAYNVIDAGGKVEADDAFNVVAKGNDFTGYTGVDAIWGETWGNASESFVIKVLDANDNVMGTTSLDNIGGIIDGDVNVTWHITLPGIIDEDQYWIQEWTTDPSIDNMPAKVELWVDGVKVSGGNVVLNGPDEIAKIYAAVTDAEGEILSYHTSIADAVAAITNTRSNPQGYIALLRHTDETVTLPAGITLNLNGFTAANVSVPVAQIGETPYYTLAEAVAAAQDKDVIEIIKEGNYTLPEFAGKELTFKGSLGTSITDWVNKGSQGMMGSTVNFENLTISGQTENYYGLFHTNAVTYKDCKINGLRFLYSPTTFTNCAFNANGVEHSFWTYGASNVTVKNSTFTYTDRAVNCYSEAGANHELVITFEGCSFTYAGTNDTPEGAVEINSGSVKSINLVMNDCTGPAKGAMWFNSRWDSKKGENTVVTIDGEIVWQVLPVAKIGDVQYKSLQAALNAAAAGTGNVTVEILRDIDLTGIDWNPVTVSGPGYPSVTVNGNDKTITGLNDMLFAGTWAGNSGLIINDLTIANSNIVNDKDDAIRTVGVGAFIGYPQASETITLNNCHLKDSHVEGGHWTGGLIGIAGGYSGTDGPVFMNLTITGCSVTGSTITGKGSAGGVIAHGTNDPWTNLSIESTTVSGNSVISTGSDNNKAGAIMGTIGAAGQPTTVNGVTHTGGATVSATVSGNTVKSNNVEITTIYGRQGTSTGMLELNGGLYDNYPIEEDKTYAAPAEGYEIEENEDGTYGVVFSAVAQIGTKYYSDLHEAMVAAKSGETVKLVNDVDLAGTEWEPVSFKGIFDGQDHIISNLTINKPGVSTTGFITSLNGSFGNVIFKNPTVTGGENTAVVAGRAGGDAAYAHNITINGTIKVETTHSGYARTGGIVGGWAYGKYENITIDGGDKATSYIKHTGGGDGRYVAGIVGHADGVDSYTNCTVKNITISGGWLCGGIAGPGPADDGLATGCSVENIDMGADYSGGMFGWYYGDGTIKDATIKDVTFTDGSTNNGIIGGYSQNTDANVENLTYENVQNSNGAPLLDHVASIGNKHYFTFKAALDAVNDGETITLLGRTGDEKSTEIEFTKDITFTITGKAPNYALPIVTFQNTTVNIEDATILIPELDARQDATINVIDSKVYDAGGNSIAKSYYNGAINISGTSEVYMMQVTTMGYINISGTAKLHATWQTNVYGNGLITLNNGTTFNTAALHLTAQDYSGRDNTDAARIGKPAEIVVDGANFTVGNVHSAGGADYSYNSSHGINVGTVEGKSAILNIKNSSNVNIYMANGETANIGAGGTVNIAASTLNTFCRTENGTVTLANNGTVYVTGAANLSAANVTGAGWFYMNGVALDADTKLSGAKVGFINGENTIEGSTIDNGFFSVGIGQNTAATTAATFAGANGITLGNVTVNVSENAIIGGNGEDYSGWVGSAYSADKTQHTYTLNVENSLAAFGYMHVSKDGIMKIDGRSDEDNRYTYDNANVNFYAGNFIVNGNVAINNADAWVRYTKMSVDHADGVLNITGDTNYESSIHNGSTTGTSLRFYNAGKVNIETSIEATPTVEIDNGTVLVDGAELNIASANVIAKGAVTGNGTINLTHLDAKFTAQEGLTVNNGVEGNTDSAVVYVDGAYQFAQYVAQIGDNKYLTLAEAFAAVQNDETITLLGNVTEVFAINNTNNVTLEMANYTLTGAVLPSTANVTIQNGNIINSDNSHSAIEINSGSLNLNNVNISSARHAVRIDGGVTATINGGTYRVDEYNVKSTRYAVNVSGNATVTILDGTFVGPYGDNTSDSGAAVNVKAGASVTIEDGNFSGGKCNTLSAQGSLVVTGGTYTRHYNDDTTPESFLAEGYEAVQIDENVYEVRISSFEKFYTAAGVETTQDQAAYSLMFNVTDNENNELSVNIGNKKPAQNSSINLVTPVTATFDGITFNVTSIADNGFNSTRFKTVTISEGVATIGTKALANMSALTDIVFPSTLKSIGDNCFYGYGENHKIKTITCYAEEAPVAASHYTEVPFQMVICKVAALIVPNAVSYEEYATAPGWSRFYEEPNGGLINHILGIGTEIEIAGKDDKYTMIATITSMDPMECSIKIGNTKPTANSNAELVIPETVTFFEGYDFNVTSIPNNAFSTCYNFTGNLEIPATVKTIGNSAFLQAYYNTLNVGKLTLNEGLETILNSAFTLSYFNNENLVIPTTVTTIGSHAFNATNMSDTLTVQNNIPGGFSGFAGSLFTMVVVKEGVTSIVDSSSKGVFSNMSKLETVILPSTLEEIGVAAFSQDTTITTITINAAVPPTVQNANVFEQEVYSKATLFVPNHAAKASYKEAYVWKEFAHISTPIIEQTTQLNAGWNWFSYYVDTDLAELEEALGENGVQITSKTDGFVAYNSQYGWSGILSSITESQMYMINVGASHDLELSGELVGPTSITLHQGWNWIGFPMSEAVSVTDALAGFEAKPGDQIKSKDNGFASYNSQYGWGGALSTLNPGEGYMYQSNNSETTELFYSAGTRGELKANITTDGNHWIPNAGQYPNNMTMTAMVEVEGGDYEVAAFVNGECRGSARPIYIEALDAHILFLTIHGEDVEEMTFKFYDLATGEEYALNDRMNYSNDAIVGTLAEPYIFNRGTTGIGEVSLSEVNIYPNPTTTGTEINLQATCDTVEVFNALGVKVAEYHNVDSIDAFETAGIYVIRITDNGDVKHCRLIVK